MTLVQMPPIPQPQHIEAAEKALQQLRDRLSLTEQAVSHLRKTIEAVQQGERHIWLPGYGNGGWFNFSGLFESEIISRLETEVADWRREQPRLRAKIEHAETYVNTLRQGRFR